MLVEVTQEDIDNGQYGDGWKCPVHLALWRATHQSWCVGATLASALEPPPRRIVRLPAQVIKFNAAFDARQPVEPFTFEFNPEEVVTCANLTKSATQPAV